MDEYEYQTKIRKIKRGNHIWFGAILGGLAGLVIGTRVYINNPNLSYEQKKNLCEEVRDASSFIIGGTSLFFAMKEYGQLRNLEEEYQEGSDKRKRQ